MGWVEMISDSALGVLLVEIRRAVASSSAVVIVNHLLPVESLCVRGE